MENTGTELTTRQGGELAVKETNAAMVGRVQSMIDTVHELYSKIMKEGIDYGKVPGCGDKPAILKPACEKMFKAFKASPVLKIERIDYDGGHREFIVTTTITDTETGAVIGDGVGSCSTLETKYRYRDAKRVCPVCGKETIIKGKKEFGGGFICWFKEGKSDGCGAKFPDNDPAIVNQVVGKIENTDPADQYNTVLKMAAKRSRADACLTNFMASDILTQDIDEQLPTDAKPANKAAPETKNEKQEPPASGTPASNGAEKPLSAFDMIVKYKNEKAKSGAAAIKELSMVIDANLKDKDLRDCTEWECKAVLDAITAHYAGKKNGKEGK